MFIKVLFIIAKVYLDSLISLKNYLPAAMIIAIMSICCYFILVNFFCIFKIFYRWLEKMLTINIFSFLKILKIILFYNS